MKRHIIVLFFTILAISACEKDDFCIQNPVTPSLVLRFYNKDNKTQTKNAQRLSAIAQGKTDSLFTNQTIDSIAFPLNSLTKKTVYTLKINTDNGATANNQTATLTIEYTPQDEYVSRSCGYRVIFNDVTLKESGWINSISTNTIATINNQSNAHVKVFH